MPYMNLETKFIPPDSCSKELYSLSDKLYFCQTYAMDFIKHQNEVRHLWLKIAKNPEP